jgi:hypothetical protein
VTKGKIGDRQKKLEKKFNRDKIEQCPICGRKDVYTKLVRHIMNSRGNQEHEEFISTQDNKILYIFDNVSDYNCSIDMIAFSPGMFCSSSHVRMVLNLLRPDWKKKTNAYRSRDTKEQYSDGRRKKSHIFGKGWKASEELGTGNYMSCKKRNAIIQAFSSNKQIKEIAAEINCKSETIIKIWREKFSDIEYEARLDKTWRFLKPSAEAIKQIEILFNSDKSCREVSVQFNTSFKHIETIWRRVFGNERYSERADRMRKLGIIKSLEAMGRMTSSGQGSQPEYECFKKLSVMLPGNIVIHHDMDILPPFEIDISIPSKKMVILWDGPLHRHPIFGQSRLEKVQYRDEKKTKTLKEKGWVVIVVEDDCKKFKYINMDTIASNIISITTSGIHKIAIGEKGELR